MMDDERYRKGYNEARAECLMRNKSKCCLKFNISTKNRECEEDEFRTCPIFVMVSKIAGLKYGM